MTKFTLIEQLQNPAETSDTPDNGISYQQYELTVESVDYIIQIPVREGDAFEQHIEENERLSKRDLKKILREVRGLIREKKG